MPYTYSYFVNFLFEVVQCCVKVFISRKKGKVEYFFLMFVILFTNFSLEIYLFFRIFPFQEVFLTCIYMYM